MKLLLSDHAATTRGAEIAAIAARHSMVVDLLTISACEMDPALAAGIDIGWYSRDIFIGGEAGRMSPSSHSFFSSFDRALQPRWLQVMSAGADLPLYKTSLQRKVMMTTASGVTAIPIATTVVAGLMGLSRGFPRWLDAQAKKQWRRTADHDAPRDLMGQHAVIVGLGPIGIEVARLLRALGLRTTGVRQRAEDCTAVDRTLRYQEIDQALGDCDWLIACCPLSKETQGLINTRRLAMLPGGAHLINVGRGPVVEETALIASLQSGHLAGAYLDVFAREPLDPASPLWEMPKVWISPHNSAASTGNAQRDAELFLDNLDRFLGAGKLRNLFRHDA